jgi:predicted Zn-dependent protease
MEVILALLLFWNGQDLLRQGLEALKAGRVREARVALEQAAKVEPNSAVIWMALADARLREGDPGAAAEAIRQATRLEPGSPMVTKGRAMFARRMGESAQTALDARDEKQAEAILRPAVQTFPTEPELWRLLGLSLYAQGRNAAATEAFVKAIDLRPDEESLYAGLETLLPGGKPVEARLAAYAAKHPDAPLGWYLLGLQRSEPALLEKAWQLDNTFWPAAFALHRTVPPERALTLLEQVAALNPAYAPAHYALAQIHAKRGDRVKAAEARRRHHELTKGQ